MLTYSGMKQVVLITAGVVIVITLIVGFFTLNQANDEKIALTSRLQSRTQLIADSLSESVEPAITRFATTSVERTVNKIAQSERIAGLAVFNAGGTPLATSDGLAPETLNSSLVSQAMDSDQPREEYSRIDDQSVYVSVFPLHNEGRVIGALLVVQNTQFINDAVNNILLDNLIHLLLQILVFGGAVFALTRWVFFKPLQELAASIQAARRGDLGEKEMANGSRFFTPLVREFSQLNTSLRQARNAASEEARLRLEKIDSPWTAERLKEFMKEYLKNRPLFVVSNREPYVHQKQNGNIVCTTPASGMVTAIEPILAAVGGTWIAHGSGSADREVVDKQDKIAVPPEEPKYTLKRVWLTPEEEQGYYSGVSNDALWPLCHQAHVRPMFREKDWEEYRKVNGLFTKSLLAEIKNIERPLILVQDFHPALLPAMIKRARPDAQIALFWHIPWPSPSQFSICPWRKELLEGILGADLIGFHTQQYCNNFIDTVAAEIESRIDYEQFSITKDEHQTFVKPFPISIAFPDPEEPTHKDDTSAMEALNIQTEFLGIGVDRLDYTKGIPERFKGIEFFLNNHPEFREKFTFLQVASPTRESVPAYQHIADAVTEEAQRVNDLFATRTWKPIILEKKFYSHDQLRPLLRRAQVCLVTPVHDGMNLVAKEYVAARNDEQGVLILSRFTGAARDLKQALLINPYSAEDTADMIHKALTMPKTEQHRRMKALRNSIKDYNIYRWSAELIKALAQID